MCKISGMCWQISRRCSTSRMLASYIPAILSFSVVFQCRKGHCPRLSSVTPVYIGILSVYTGPINVRWLGVRDELWSWKGPWKVFICYPSEYVGAIPQCLGEPLGITVVNKTSMLAVIRVRGNHSWDFSVLPKVNPSWEGPLGLEGAIMSSPTKFELNLINNLSANVWIKASPIIGQEIVVIQWNMTKELSKLGRFAVHPPNLDSIPSANAWKLLEKSEAMRWPEFNRTWPKVDHACGAFSELTHQIWDQSDQWFACKCTESVQWIRNGGNSAEGDQKYTKHCCLHYINKLSKHKHKVNISFDLHESTWNGLQHLLST